MQDHPSPCAPTAPNNSGLPQPTTVVHAAAPSTAAKSSTLANPAALLAHALGYAARGWPVLPLHSIVGGRCTCGKDCSSPGKHPRTQNGLKAATCDATQIHRWWTRWPNANIGICTGAVSRLVVLDVDTGKGGPTSLAALEQRHGPLPQTVRQHTGGGGWHILFAYPSVCPGIKNSAGTLGPGLDIRADGGYIVAAPSNHRSGAVYRWPNGPDVPDSTIAPLPTWLLQWLTADKTRAAPKTAAAPKDKNLPPAYTQTVHFSGQPVREGQRNMHLTRTAGALRHRNMDRSEIERRLLEENVRVCTPPLEPAEVAAIARSISRYEPGPPLALKYAWLDWVKSEYGPPSPITRQILMALGSYMDEQGGKCYPTIDRLARETALNVSTIKRHLKAAVNNGWLRRYHHRFEGQNWRNYGYVAVAHWEQREDLA